MSLVPLFCPICGEHVTCAGPCIKCLPREQHTPEDKAVMNDQELIKAVAIEVMEWKEFDSRHYFPRMFYVSEEKPWPGYIMAVNAWNPIENTNHWMMVVEKLKPYYYFELNNFGDQWYAGFYKDLPPVVLSETDEKGFARDNQLGRAICLAALATVRGERWQKEIGLLEIW